MARRTVALSSLALFAMVLLWPVMAPCEEESAPLKSANALFTAGKHAEAEKAFREILAGEIDPAMRGKATFNLGLTLKKLNRLDEAMKVFASLLEQPVNDQEPGGHLMEPYRNYRPRAQWEIGLCLLEKKDYSAARTAFKTTKEKYPFRSWCGNESAAYKYRYAFYDGLCLEHLGKPELAIGRYYKATFDSMGLYNNPTAQIRIVDLYTATGQEAGLKRLLDEIDQYFVSAILKEAEDAGRKLDEKNLNEIDQFKPAALMRRLIELRQFGKEGRRSELLSCLKVEGEYWERPEAVRLLAATPQESTQELLAILARPREDAYSNPHSAYAYQWVMRALGRCGTKEGVAWLKERASREENYESCRLLIQSLSEGGDEGARAIGELEQTAKDNLKDALDRYREGKLVDRSDQPEEFKFPQPAPNVRLPEKLAELDEELAYRSSLPKTVKVDLSTPESVARSFLLARVIGDSTAISICTGQEHRPGGDFQKGSFDEPWPRFTVGKTVHVSDSEADVSYEFRREDQIERGAVQVKKDAKGWRVRTLIRAKVEQGGAVRPTEASGSLRVTADVERVRFKSIALGPVHTIDGDSHLSR